MAPLTRCRADGNRAPTELMATYYQQRASAGLIVSEATQVAPEGIGYLGTPGIYTDAQVQGWKRVTKGVHDRGGRIVLQLWHVGRASHSSFQPNGQPPVAPSAIAAKGMAMTMQGPVPLSTPRALETQEIAGVVEQFRRGAERAKEAGFDGVEIHGANGYLIDQFLRDGSNQRTDSYGGSIENRARFMLEVTSAVVGVWGADRVGIRLSPNGTFNDMRDSDPIKTFTHALRELQNFNLAYLHLIELMEGDKILVPLSTLRAAYQGAIMVNASYTGERAEAVISEGLAQLVSFGKLFISNPDLPERLKLGRPLATPNHLTFYGGGAAGYTDYPTL
jgi:N-ethylmaleimide reductase